MAQFGRRGIAYTPFFQAGAQAIGDAMGIRRERMEEDRINELAQAAWMGDPIAVQELAREDPDLAADIELQAAERQDRDIQRQVDKDARFVEDLDTAMAQISMFEDFEDAQPFGQRITNMLMEKYPERMAARGEAGEFTPEVFEEIRTIVGGAGGIGEPIGVHFPGVDRDGNPVMYERLKLPNGRTIARKIRDEETGEYITPARFDAETAYRMSYSGKSGTEQAVIDLADDAALAKLSAEAKTQIMPARRDAEATIGVINQIRAHPGLKHAVGLGWLNPLKFAPGTEAHNFMVLADQAQGKVFAQAYETLKGGGQITEIESQKAEQAIARMETSQSVPEYMAALEDFEDAVRAGYDILLKQAAGEFEVDTPLTARAPREGEPGFTEETAIDATTLDEKPPAGTWVRFPDGTVRQM